MIQRGYNVAGDPQLALPAACNLLKADRFMIGDTAQYDLAYCNQFAGERVLWLTRWTDPRSIRHWFKPNGRTLVNLWNEEEWFSQGTFTPDLALARLVQQLEWLAEVDATAQVSVQIGVQWNALGWAPRAEYPGTEWFLPIWQGLAPSLRERIALFNLHFYEPSGDTQIGKVLEFVQAVRSKMDNIGAGAVGIRIGEIGLDRKLSTGVRADSYPARLFRRMNEWNAQYGLGIEDIYLYCAGAYPSAEAESRYISLVEYGVPALTAYGQSFAASRNQT